MNEKPVVDLVEVNDQGYVFCDLSQLKYSQWNILCSEFNLTEDILRKYNSKMNWYNISTHQKLSEDFIREYADKVDWHRVSKYQTLSDDFIISFMDRIDWYNLCSFKDLSLDVLRKCREKIYWGGYFEYRKVPESILNEFEEETVKYLNNVVRHQSLSEEFLRKYASSMSNYSWESASKCQKLSESFMNDYADKFDWKLLCEYQNMSSDFVLGNITRVDKNSLKKNQNRAQFPYGFWKIFEATKKLVSF
jgi:hypothetical protein